MKVFTLIMTVLLVAGCASKQTTKKQDLAERLFDLFEDYARAVSDAEISRVASTKPELPPSSKIAVFFQDPSKKAKSKQDWNWTQEDKDMIISSIDRSGGKVGRAFELVSTGRPQDDIDSLRLMAAQQGADGLLLIQGLSEVDTDMNGWALSYLVVLPAFFVEGNEVEGTFLSQAVLWDVNYPFVHLGLRNEGDYEHDRPIVFRQISRVINKSKEESLLGLSHKLQEELLRI